MAWFLFAMISMGLFGLVLGTTITAARREDEIRPDASGKCSNWGVSIRPDGVNELDPCEYREVQKVRNVTVTVLQCVRCGHMEVAWERQDDSEEVYLE